MAIHVVTMSRQLGSGGDELANQLAARFGWKQLDREIIERAARASGAPDAALAALDEFKLLDMRPSGASRKAHREGVEAVVRQAAREGHVIILGRGAQVILRGEPEVLHLKVVSPPEMRVRRIMATAHLDEATAMRRLATSDRSRAAYLRQEYRANWLDPLLYDLIINLKTHELDWAIELVAEAIQSRS